MDNCTIVNHLTTLELQRVLNESGFVISRCGYTTVMEILSLGKKSILVPTPGQTEQEYLAEHLMQQRWCYSCRQDEDLLAHIKKAKEFGFRCPLFEKDHLKPAAASFIARYLAV
jgi:UDP-N-acetylglucosamine:LPS N-acetylglucosamine transferase